MSGGFHSQHASADQRSRSEEHTSELQSQSNLVCRLLLEKKKTRYSTPDRSPRRTSTPTLRLRPTLIVNPGFRNRSFTIFLRDSSALGHSHGTHLFRLHPP